MTTAFISLGSNLGDRIARMREAAEELASRAKILRASKIYETAPMYVEDQPPFLNAAVEIDTNLGPLPLLKTLKAIEAEIGRRASERFGPREIDLDLIAYGGLRYRFTMSEREVLVLPHPRTIERRFVLQPLFDIDPKLELPGLGSVQNLLESTESQASTVHEISDALLPVFGH